MELGIEVWARSGRHVLAPGDLDDAGLRPDRPGRGLGAGGRRRRRRRPARSSSTWSGSGVCGTDVEFFTGEMAYLHQGHAPYPMRLGHEWCGTVAAVGDGVDPAWLGRRVTGDTMLGCGSAAGAAGATSTSASTGSEVGIRGGRPGALAEQLAVPVSVAARAARRRGRRRSARWSSRAATRCARPRRRPRSCPATGSWCSAPAPSACCRRCSRGPPAPRCT